MNTHEAQASVWPWIVAVLLLAGCAADKKQSRVEQAEPDRSARAPIETPQPPADTPKTATPKGRPVPPSGEQTRKAPPVQEPTKKTPPPQEQTKKTTPPDARQQTTGEEGQSGEEERAARQNQPPSGALADRPRTEAPEEPKGEQQAKLPGERVTPLNQSGSKDDVETTRRIRQKLMNEDLSFSAKNVMVITEADRVVLKGIVNSPSEAERVKGVAGALTTKQIEDRLQIGGQ